MMDPNEEDQSNELLVLAEICSSQEFQVCPASDLKQTLAPNSESLSVHAGTLKVSPNLEDADILVIHPKGESVIKHLPPIVLDFLLPSNYPSSSPPYFRVKALWLNKKQVSSLTDKLSQLGQENEGSVVLFTWLSFLKEDSLSFLNISKSLDITEVLNEILEDLKQSQITSQPNKQPFVDGARALSVCQPVDESVDASAEKMSPVDLQTCDNKQTSLKEQIHAEKRSKKFGNRNYRTKYKTNLNSEEQDCETKYAKPENDSRPNSQSQNKLADNDSKKTKAQRKPIKKPTKLAQTDPEAKVNQPTKSQNSVENSSALATQTNQHNENSNPPTISQVINENGPNQSAGGNQSESKTRHKQNDIKAKKPKNREPKFVKNEAKTTLKSTNDKLETKVAEYSDATNSDAFTGTVVRWIGDRGFGFIRQKDSKSEWYFHRTNFIGNEKEIHQAFQNMEEVTFQLRHSPRSDDFRPMAINVKSLAGSDDSAKQSLPTNLPITPPVSPEPLVQGEDSNSSTKCDDTPSKEANPTSPDQETEAQTRPEDSETFLNRLFEAKCSSLINSLLEFSNEEEARKFDQSIFACNVCFSEKMGSQSISFPDCGHVYCKDCMSAYFEVQIRDGQISNLTCPEEKCKSQALPNQVKKLVPELLYARYENQMLETTLETMSDILLCPRLSCQCPTLIEREGSMGECPKCKFAFCIYCKATFHGVAPCRMKSSEHRKLITEYMGATASQKEHLEKMYGKKQLTSMMNLMLSENYLTDNTKPCPKCNAPIQKSEGCNKMTCNKCGTHFCYLCGAKLSIENPYSHFSQVGNKCYNQLFQGAEIDDQEFFFVEDQEDLDEDGIHFVL